MVEKKRPYEIVTTTNKKIFENNVGSFYVWILIQRKKGEKDP